MLFYLYIFSIWALWLWPTMVVLIQHLDPVAVADHGGPQGHSESKGDMVDGVRVWVGIPTLSNWSRAWYSSVVSSVAIGGGVVRIDDPDQDGIKFGRGCRSHVAVMILARTESDSAPPLPLPLTKSWSKTGSNSPAVTSATATAAAADLILVRTGSNLDAVAATVLLLQSWSGLDRIRLRHRRGGCQRDPGEDVFLVRT